MGRHAGKSFNHLQLGRKTEPGLYNAGPGLFLRVSSKRARSWVFRYMLDGRSREMGLGSYPEISLADARKAVEKAHQLKAKGMDPIDARKSERERESLEAAKAVTFRYCADAYIEAHKKGWKNAKHAAQWTSTLDTYAFSIVGDLPVQKVDTTLVCKILENNGLWSTKTETASRVRQRIETILSWATTRGYRQGENPARWRGHLEHLFPSRKKVREVRHHPALPYAELDFMAKLKAERGTAAQALQFAILTAARTDETIKAQWPEIDFDKALWTVPGDRMKSKREHRVPLPKPTLAILRARHDATGGEGYIFQADLAKKPLSNMAMLALLERMERDDITVHGFRSTFRDWVEEATTHAGSVAEAALAHVIGDETEAAYRRGDLFEKRRKLMNAWATFCMTPAEHGKVINIKRSSAGA